MRIYYEDAIPESYLICGIVLGIILQIKTFKKINL